MPKDTTENDSLISIVQGASLFLIGKAVFDLFGFLLQLVLTRWLGKELYGLYAYGHAINGILLTFTTLGSDKALLKYLPEYEDDTLKQRFVLGLATITSFLGGIVASGLVLLLAPSISAFTLDDPLFTDVLRLFALILVFDTLSQMLRSTFRSLERLEYHVLTHKVANPSFRLVAAIVALSLGFSVFGVVVALLVASIMTFLLSLYILLTQFDVLPTIPKETLTRQSVYEYYNYSIPLTVTGIGRILMNRVDILMVGFFLPTGAVGVYNISVLIGTFITLPLSAFNQLFPPIASKLYSNQKIPKLNSIYTTVTRWIFTASLILVIGAIIYRYEILTLFGEGFTEGTTVLILFAIAQLFNCVGGSNGYLLMMTEHQYVLLVTQWFFGISNIILNYILILKLGFIGAAMATASVLAIMNVVKTIQLWYLEDLFPYSVDFLKPISAGAVSALVMYGARYVTDGISLLIVGGGSGTIIYAILLVILGIEEQDKELFSELLTNL